MAVWFGPIEVLLIFCSVLIFMKMKSFYQEWLRKNSEENREAQMTESQDTSKDPIPSTSSNVPSQQTEHIPSTSSRLNVPLQTPMEDIQSTSSNVSTQNDIVFENDQFVLFIEKEAFLRQKRFNLQDHLFHVKIKIKNNTNIPFLKDILDFLEKGLLHVMSNIKKFYKEEDANICFLTLFQQPMVNALNSGMSIRLFHLYFIISLLKPI